MEKFAASYTRNPETGTYRIFLQYIQGRGGNLKKNVVMHSKDLIESDFIRKFKRTESYANTLNRLMEDKKRGQIQISRYPTEKGVVKNINSIAIASELSALLHFFRESNLTLAAKEETSLLFLICEDVFKLENKPFKKAKEYIYPKIDLNEKEIEIFFDSIKDKALSINQLLECYLLEKHDIGITEILFPEAYKAHASLRPYYDDFMDKGIIDSCSANDCIVHYGSLQDRMILTTVKAIAETIFFLISRKTGLSITKVKEIISSQGERVVMSNGLSISKKNPTNSGKRLLRSYNMTYREVELSKIEEYSLYVLTNIQYKDLNN